MKSVRQTFILRLKRLHIFVTLDKEFTPPLVILHIVRPIDVRCNELSVVVLPCGNAIPGESLRYILGTHSR
jgi:hypothetical protein